MYKISKEFHFSASHVLHGLEPDHPCGRMHGHNYTVKVELAGPTLNNVGFITDYNDLGPIKRFIDNKMDHRHLNDVFPSMQPSAELLARELFELFKPDFPNLSAVEVKETPKTVARYEWTD